MKKVERIIQMVRYLVDTNILRFYLEGNPAVVNFIQQCETNGDILLLSRVTIGELRSQIFEIKPQYRKPLRKLIKAFPSIETIDIHDRRAHAYRRIARSIRLKHEQLKMPSKPRLPGLADAKIAVDAFNERVSIITNNTKDFHIARFLGLSIYDPIRNIWFDPIQRTNTPPGFIFPEEYP